MHYIWVALVSKDWYYDGTESSDIGDVICSLDWDQSYHGLIFHEVTNFICKMKGCALIGKDCKLPG